MIDEVTRNDVLDFARAEVRHPAPGGEGSFAWLWRVAKLALEQEEELQRLRKPPAFNSNSAIIPLEVAADQIPTIEGVVRRHIKAVLEALSGNKTRAARILGIDRRSLYRWLARMEEPPPGGLDARMVGLRDEPTEEVSDPIGLHSMVEGNRE